MRQLVWSVPPRGPSGLCRQNSMLSIESMFNGTRNTPAKVPDAHSIAIYEIAKPSCFNCLFPLNRHGRASLNGCYFVRVGPARGRQRSEGRRTAGAGVYWAAWQPTGGGKVATLVSGSRLATKLHGGHIGCKISAGVKVTTLESAVESADRQGAASITGIHSSCSMPHVLPGREQRASEEQATGAGAHGLGPAPQAAWSPSSSTLEAA